jgi:hypothetical protein
MDYDFDYEILDGGFTLLSVGVSLPLRKVKFTVRVDHYVWIDAKSSRTELQIQPYYSDPVPNDAEANKAIAQVIDRLGKSYSSMYSPMRVDFVNMDLPEEQFQAIESELKATGDWVRNGVMTLFC